ncbi:UBA domain-containing protein 7 [Fusarium oxysporum f. sp. albedinis]|nr:UBA domain-containing protein 7 [Fusarium oxysporum f. sp. albedinis]
MNTRREEDGSLGERAGAKRHQKTNEEKLKEDEAWNATSFFSEACLIPGEAVPGNGRRFQGCCNFEVGTSTLVWGPEPPRHLSTEAEATASQSSTVKPPSTMIDQ